MVAGAVDLVEFAAAVLAALALWGAFMEIHYLRLRLGWSRDVAEGYRRQWLLDRDPVGVWKDGRVDERRN